MVVEGTLFPYKNIGKVAWIAPDQRTKNKAKEWKSCFMVTQERSQWKGCFMDLWLYTADIGSDH